MKDARLTACPKESCPGPVHRKIGRGAGIIFKGSGFYQTDYRSDSYKKAAEADKAELLDQLKRSQAEFQNFRKRAEREKVEFAEYAGTV